MTRPSLLAVGRAHTVGDMVGTLTAHVDRLAAGLMDDRIDGIPWEVLAATLHHIRQAREGIQKLENGLERAIAQRQKAEGITGPVEVEGVGVVQVRRGKERKAWDHHALAAAVIDAHLTGGDGVEPSPWDVRDWLMAAAAPSYWRVGVLRGLGLRAGDFCTEEPGTLSVQIISSDRPKDPEAGTLPVVVR